VVFADEEIAAANASTARLQKELKFMQKELKFMKVFTLS